MLAGESAVSLAAAARLVLDYGYPVDTVEVESPKGEVDGVAYQHHRPSRPTHPRDRGEAR